MFEEENGAEEGLSTEQIEKLAELDHIFHRKEDESAETSGQYFAMHSKVERFYHLLLTKYSDSEIRDRRLFHIIIHSSVHNKKCPEFDFAGEFSIEKFIREL